MTIPPINPEIRPGAVLPPVMAFWGIKAYHVQDVLDDIRVYNPDYSAWVDLFEDFLEASGVNVCFYSSQYDPSGNSNVRCLQIGAFTVTPSPRGLHGKGDTFLEAIIDLPWHEEILTQRGLSRDRVGE